MGKFISVIVGIVAIVLGIYGLINWFSEFLDVLAGVVPIMFIFGGLIAAFLGISEVKDEMAAKKEEKKDKA